jgi:type II secretory ATPase GspE/PulE/Tfp pilus assembly ATPase PilB-like protein
VTPEFIETVKSELKNIPLSSLEEKFGAGFTLDKINESMFFEGAGCQYCKNTGFAGRIAIVEIIDVNHDLQDTIMDSKKILKEEDIRKNQDFITMKEDGFLKSLQGLTTIQEVLRVIQD